MKGTTINRILKLLFKSLKILKSSAKKLTVGGALILLIKMIAQAKLYDEINKTPLLNKVLREFEFSYIKLIVKKSAEEVNP
jgi:hypothetical protein